MLPARSRAFAGPRSGVTAAVRAGVGLWTVWGMTGSPRPDRADAFASPPRDAGGGVEVVATSPRAPELVPYHRTLRAGPHETWKVWTGLALFVVGMLIVVPLMLMPVFLVGVYLESTPETFLDNLISAAEMEVLSPGLLLWVNLTLAGLIPLTWLLTRYLHGVRPRWLTSVAPRIRWRFLAASAAVAVVALGVQLGVGTLLPAGKEAGLDIAGGVNEIDGRWLALAAIVVLTTPLQAIGEEYAFRGYLLQLFGALWANKWVPITVTALLFALAHGAQNVPLFADRFVFGFAAAWLVVRTGGLETGIAWHVVNNLTAFSVALLFADIDSVLTVSSISYWHIPVTLSGVAVYVAGTLWVFNRSGLQSSGRPRPAALERRQHPAA